ncbi:MAG: OmpA family protein [Saprospiraceae bacterium]
MKKIRRLSKMKEFLLLIKFFFLLCLNSYFHVIALAQKNEDGSIHRYIEIIKGEGNGLIVKGTGATEKSNIIAIEIIDNKLYFINKEDGLFVIEDLSDHHKLKAIDLINILNKNSSIINGISLHKGELFLFFDNRYCISLKETYLEKKRFRYLGDNLTFSDFVIEDKVDDILVATKGTGLHIYPVNISSQAKKYSITGNNFISNNVNALFKDSNGIIWIGTDKGLAVYSHSEGLKSLCTPKESFIKQIFNRTKGVFIDYSVEAITERYGKIIIAGREGIHELTVELDSITGIKSLGVKEKLGNASIEFVNSLLVDYRSDLWVAGNLLFKYDFSEESVVKIYNESDTYNSQRAHCLAEDRMNNKIWVGTAGSGIFIIENGVAIPPPKTKKEIPVNSQFIADQILFEADSRIIKAESLPYLDTLAEKLTQLHQKNCLTHVLIQGHSSKDKINKPLENKQLSLNRAENIGNYLINKGKIPPNLISYEGMGDAQPNKNCVDDQYAPCHRRVEIRIESSCH